jgi:hypothetical protein
MSNVIKEETVRQLAQLAVDLDRQTPTLEALAEVMHLLHAVRFLIENTEENQRCRGEL